MIRVKLTPSEVHMGALVGVHRRVASLGFKDNHGYNDADGWTVDIEGACAEVAFAKATRRYWDGGVATFKAADVGKSIQIRYTPHEDGCLIVRDADPGEHAYILVTGKAPDFRIIGGMRGEEAKAERWKRAPNGRPAAYFVPQAALYELPDDERDAER
jgi:hypothetical protein